MKTMLLPLSFLLASSITLFPEASASGTPVLDVKGLPLLPNFPYYLVSSEGPFGIGGVVSSGNAIYETNCQVDVILRQNNAGIPVKISVADGQIFPYISDFTDVYLSFDAASNCSKSIAWQHAKDSAGFAQFLTVGGVDQGDVNTIFMIIPDGPYGFVYKIAAYVLSSNTDHQHLHVYAGDVGVAFDYSSGIRRLALTEPPLWFVFEVAESVKDM